ncbi:HK97 family phage prohead protease [Virgibacillus natechei]
MKEIRTVELRTEQENNDLVVTGVPVVFDTATQINDPMGGYTEVIKRNALDGVDLTDTRLLYNHDLSKIPLAKAPKTMELYTDDKGLNMRATLPDTEEGRSVYTAVKRGDLTGMSFSFTCDKAGSQYNAKTQTRSISKINKLYECSIVPFPAYQTTSVEARSQMQEAEQQEKEKQDARIKLNQILTRSVK